MSTKSGAQIDRFIRGRMKDGQISATTLVFTFFCDVVTQHEGEIWLGSVIHSLAPLGINERLTRTAVFRLVKDGWLESRKSGRRSYYRLTRTGQNYYRRAAQRIYSITRPEWDGAWTLILTSPISEDQRDALNRGLLWLGYGRIANSVFAYPRHPHPALHELLTDLKLEDQVVLMRAETDTAQSLKQLVLNRWKLGDLKERYGQYNRLYNKALKALQSDGPQNAHSLLLLRVLMIHEYRKILLGDPELPTAMLPEHWQGFAAQTLTANIYRQLAKPTSNWASQELRGLDGHFKFNATDLNKRFSV